MRMFQLTDHLYWGGAEAFTPATMTVDLWTEGDIPLHLRQFHPGGYAFLWPMVDGELPDLEILQRTCRRLAEEWVSLGKTVLVRCNAGSNRSALVAGTILSYYLQCPGKLAVRRIRELREDTLFNPWFYDWLVGWKPE